MSDRFVSLKLDRSQINSNFDGYKLSLDSMPCYQRQLEGGVDATNLTEEQYSFQHVKAFGAHNHLAGDPWNPQSVYWVDDKWHVVRASVSQESNTATIDPVFTIPEASAQRIVPGRLNVSLHLTAAQWAVLADGAGCLYLLDTGDRGSSAEWKAVYSKAVLEDTKAYSVLHSCWYLDNGVNYVDCVLAHVEEISSEASATNPFCTKLEWVTVTSADGSVWALERRRTLQSASAPDYAAIEPGGQAIFVASQKPYMATYDSVMPVAEEKPEAQNGSSDENGSDPPLYKWTQTIEDLTIYLPLPEGILKNNLDVQMRVDQVAVGVKNGDAILQGKLYGRIDVEASTWTLEDNVLSVELAKHEPEMWPFVIEGDTKGEMVPLEESATGAIMNEEFLKKPYNTQELEECDAFPDDASVMLRIHGNTHQVTHQVNLGSHQWLFNTILDVEQMPAICLRHDVDGIVWQPLMGEDQVNPWKHAGTFDALGYVKASKSENKFAASPPNGLYAVLCDCVRHAYVYRQPSDITSPLRNRKTGREVTQVAKQQVVSLNSVDNILGLCATNERIFLLTNKTLHIIKV